MSIHNIGFYEDLTKIIFQLSQIHTLSLFYFNEIYLVFNILHDLYIFKKKFGYFIFFSSGTIFPFNISHHFIRLTSILSA